MASLFEVSGVTWAVGLAAIIMGFIVLFSIGETVFVMAVGLYHALFRTDKRDETDSNDYRIEMGRET